MSFFGLSLPGPIQSAAGGILTDNRALNQPYLESRDGVLGHGRFTWVKASLRQDVAA